MGLYSVSAKTLSFYWYCLSLKSMPKMVNLNQFSKQSAVFLKNLFLQYILRETSAQWPLTRISPPR